MSDIILGLLLAAGSSRRFGADKLAQTLPGGETVAIRACSNLLAGVDRVLTVVRPGADKLAEKLQALGAEIVVCRDAEQGMGASLACAVRSSPPDIRGWLVALADMPWIEPETIRAVAEALRHGEELAAPCFRGRRGHPVGFSSRHRQGLSSLRGDEGAKSLILAHEDSLRLIEVDDPGVLRDVDRRKDLIAYCNVPRPA